MKLIPLKKELQFSDTEPGKVCFQAQVAGVRLEKWRGEAPLHTSCHATSEGTCMCYAYRW